MTYKILGGVILLVVLSIAYYGIAPLFMNVKVDDALPMALKDEIPTMPVISEPVQIVDTAVHPASGTVRIVEADGARYVRYENYKTINGPDIFVYLAKDLDAKEFVNLGRVKATEGNINYEIPDGVNPDEYRYVLTWCRAFGVLFNFAEINPATP